MPQLKLKHSLPSSELDTCYKLLRVALLKNGLTIKQAFDLLEAALVEATLLEGEGSPQRGANILGINRTTFCEKMKKHGIRREYYEQKA